jgi:ABC-type sugar transport system ATPase subunit
MGARRTTLAVMTGLLLLLAGCGGGGDGAGGADGGVSLTIWADDKYSRAIRGSATQWGEQNDVRVSVQTVSEDLQSVFVTAVAGFIGSPPMNMALGRVERQGDDLYVRLGSALLRLHPAVARQRPALASYVGQEVAAGIRSEDMEDARLVRDAPPDTRMRETVSLIEALGSEIVVHFEVDAPRVVTEDTKELEKDAHTEDVPHHEGTKFVASFAPRSRVRLGDEVEVVVDTERMHFFDPKTGLAIRD